MTRARVIPGAAGGIGTATARRAAAEGYGPLFLIDRDEEALASVADEVGGTALGLDITDAEAVARAFDRIRAETPELYGLVLAAGVVDNGKLSDLTAARWS